MWSRGCVTGRDRGKWRKRARPSINSNRTRERDRITSRDWLKRERKRESHRCPSESCLAASPLPLLVSSLFLFALSSFLLPPLYSSSTVLSARVLRESLTREPADSLVSSQSTSQTSFVPLIWQPLQCTVCYSFFFINRSHQYIVNVAAGAIHKRAIVQHIVHIVTLLYDNTFSAFTRKINL